MTLDEYMATLQDLETQKAKATGAELWAIGDAIQELKRENPEHSGLCNLDAPGECLSCGS